MTTSDYPKDHKCYSDRNKKKLGYFKDETCGVPIVEFVGLRSKMYSILLADDSVKNTAKGIQQHFSKTKLNTNCTSRAWKRNFEHSPNITVLGVSNMMFIPFTKIRLLLSSFDDKRYLLKDSHNTLAYGHYKIPKE